jgi:hypothetical protein
MATQQLAKVAGSVAGLRCAQPFAVRWIDGLIGCWSLTRVVRDANEMIKEVHKGTITFPRKNHRTQFLSLYS